MDVQSEVNIGIVGHVDHGKTSIAKALSGVWTSKYSEEIKRGITIKLGYTDFEIYKCPSCGEPECYSTNKKCKICGSKTEFQRKISLVDTPGHETLMAVMLSGSAVMDGCILAIAANEKCPQPQTAEHLTALEVLGIKEVVVAQNKIDLLSKEDAVKNQEQIKDFIKNTIPDAQIIPIAAHYNANIDALIKAVQDFIPTKKKVIGKPFMYIIRSFDVNSPGTGIEDIKGGVIGGSLLKGKLKIGDEIEIRPGVKRKNKYVPLITKVVSLHAGKNELDEAKSRGLISIGTSLDPSLTKSDSLVGNVVGLVNDLPEATSKLSTKIKLFDELLTVGKIKPLVKNEKIMISVGSALRLGTITDVKKGEIELLTPVCAKKGQRFAISRKFKFSWRLIGYGIIK